VARWSQDRLGQMPAAAGIQLIHGSIAMRMASMLDLGTLETDCKPAIQVQLPAGSQFKRRNQSLTT